MLNIEYYKDKLVELCVIDIDRLALIQGQPHICNTSISYKYKCNQPRGKGNIFNVTRQDGRYNLYY
jgi:hypothetical protein